MRILLSHYIRQHLGGVLAWIHLGVYLRDRAVLVDQVTDAIRVAGLRIVTGAVGETDLAVGVTQQRKGKVEFPSERGILFDRVEARAEDLDVESLELVLLIAEPATFNRSTRGISLWVEPQQHFAPAQAGQRERVTFVGGHREVRSRVTNVEHHDFSFR